MHGELEDETRAGKSDEEVSMDVFSKDSHVSDVTCIIKEELCDDNSHSEQNSINHTQLKSGERTSHNELSSHKETSKESSEIDSPLIQVKQENIESDQLMTPETRRNWVVSLPFDLL